MAYRQSTHRAGRGPRYPDQTSGTAAATQAPWCGQFLRRRVLVTGGLGFLGSNLVIRLVKLGARVTVVDSSVPGCGANLFNIQTVRDKVRIIPRGICEAAHFLGELPDPDVIFNLAGEISHVHSMEFPERDLQLNTVAQLQFLTACAQRFPGVRVVYAGTRQVYGVPRYLPVDENHPICPVDFNGIHKNMAAAYHLLLTDHGQLDAVTLRLTNIYGPRMALDVPCQGFLSTFLRRVLLGEPIEIFGNGQQLRDPVYVDDAVDAFLRAGTASRPPHRVYNVGGFEALRLADIGEMMVRTAGASRLVYKPFPEDREAIDIGSYYTDSTRVAEDLGWKASTCFEDGISRTLEYYRAHLPQYLDPGDPHPSCKMPEHNGERRRLTYASL